MVPHYRPFLFFRIFRPVVIGEPVLFSFTNYLIGDSLIQLILNLSP